MYFCWFFFFFKQKTAYEMRISDWSSDVCSSDLETQGRIVHIRGFGGSPLGGLSTLSFGRQAFGMAQAIDRAASATFRNGVRPSGILSTKDSLTAEQRGVAENLLQEKFAGSLHAGRPMLLDRD